MENLQQMHLENRRDIKEMRNEFRNSKSFVVGYTVKTLLELFVSVAFEFWILYKGWGNIFSCEGGDCSYINFIDCTICRCGASASGPGRYGNPCDAH